MFSSFNLPGEVIFTFPGLEIFVYARSVSKTSRKTTSRRISPLNVSITGTVVSASVSESPLVEVRLLALPGTRLVPIGQKSKL